MQAKAYILDDEPLLIETLADFFDESGIPCKTSCSWEPQFVADANLQDILFLDLNMPGKDGLDVLKELADIHFPGKIVLLSGEDETLLATAHKIGKEHGLAVLAAMQKPFKAANLVGLFEQAKQETQTTKKNQKPDILLSAEECINAIESGYLYPVYQPQMNALNNQLDGVECLARMKLPEHGNISPAAFIPILEENGVVDLMTTHLLKKSLTEISLLKSKFGDINVSYNLSAKSVTQNFVEQLMQIVNNSGVLPQHITFEITETAAIDMSIDCRTALSKLRLKGFHLALDDFGTGFSTIKQLNELPFNEIKVDRSFVSEITQKKTSRAIVATTTKLGQSLGYRVVGEGVENAQELQYLLKQHCHIIQGFMFSKPLAIEELQQFLADLKNQQPTSKILDDKATQLLSEISPVLVKSNTKRSYEFEQILTDAYGFKVTTFANLGKEDDMSHAYVLINPNDKELIQFQEHRNNSPYVLMKDNVTIEELLSLIEAGAGECINSHIYPDALVTKLITFYLSNQKAEQKSASSDPETQALVFASMKQAAQYGDALLFMKNLIAIESPQKLGDAVTSFFKNSGLNAAFCFKHKESMDISDPTGKHCSTLLQRLFNDVSGHGRLIEFNQRLICNGKHCSVLLFNTPVDDNEKGQLRDLLASFIEVVDLKCESLLSKESWKAIAVEINNIMDTTQSTIGLLKQKNLDAVEQFSSLITQKFHSLDLTEEQERLLFDSVEELINRSDASEELLAISSLLRNVELMTSQSE